MKNLADLMCGEYDASSDVSREEKIPKATDKRNRGPNLQTRVVEQAFGEPAPNLKADDRSRHG